MVHHADNRPGLPKTIPHITTIPQITQLFLLVQTEVDFFQVMNAGIEMCEHRGNSRQETLARTAKLCASLMQQYDIPLKNVVPHYHWPRKGLKPEHKNCPHFLMTNGKPGRKWNQFLRSIKK